MLQSLCPLNVSVAFKYIHVELHYLNFEANSLKIQTTSNALLHCCGHVGARKCNCNHSAPAKCGRFLLVQVLMLLKNALQRSVWTILVTQNHWVHSSERNPAISHGHAWTLVSINRSGTFRSSRFLNHQKIYVNWICLNITPNWHAGGDVIPYTCHCAQPIRRQIPNWFRNFLYKLRRASKEEVGYKSQRQDWELSGCGF